MDITIEFSIFELVLVWSFILGRWFWFYGQKLSKKGISGPKKYVWVSPSNSTFSLGTKLHFNNPKQKKITLPTNSAFSNWSRYQVSYQSGKFIFLDQFRPRKEFPIQSRTNEHHPRIQHIGFSAGMNIRSNLWVAQNVRFVINPVYPDGLELTDTFCLLIFSKQISCML